MLLGESEIADLRTPFAFARTRMVERIGDRASEGTAILMRRQEGIAGEVEITVQPLGPRLFKAAIRVFNRTAMPPAESNDSEAVLLRTLASTHTILQMRGGEFISL